MTRVVVRTDDVAGFFSRAKSAARRADRGESFEGKVTLSFEDPQRMFTVLSEARRRLMLEVMHEARTILYTEPEQGYGIILMRFVVGERITSFAIVHGFDGNMFLKFDDVCQPVANRLAESQIGRAVLDMPPVV